MTYYYKGKEIGQREQAVGYIFLLPTRELEDFVYTYLDQFERGQLMNLIWASMSGAHGWRLRDLIEDALIVMENRWELMHSMDKLAEGETVDIGHLEYENWEVRE